MGSYQEPLTEKRGSAVTQVCSVFSQLLQLFPHREFARAVKEHKAERHAKGFTCWGQFVAMLFCQVAQLKSLREVCMGLASCESPLKHLGLSETPKKSTLAYANEHRPWELHQTIFYQLLEKTQAEVAAHGGRKKFRFKNKLVSLDGSIIDLSVTMFDWAKYRRTKGAIKLHLLLDHDGYLPSFAVVTEGKHSEVAVARGLRLEAGTILAIDRGYNDFDWFAEMTRDGVFFVTRMKTNTVYSVVEECEVPKNGNVLRDQIISLPGLKKAGEDPVLFRRIEYWNQDKQEILVFFSNLLHLAGSTIAAIYKERWKVELFFENSTWCTPLDVMRFQGSIALNRPLVGSLDGSVRPRIARRPLCAESRARSHKPATPATVSTESTAKQWSV
jgi:hypothetical protein